MVLPKRRKPEQSANRRELSRARRSRAWPQNFCRISPAPASAFSARPRSTHLVVAPDQVHRRLVLNLQGQQQADGFQGV